MKDALGHGSNAKGVHSGQIDQIGRHPINGRLGSELHPDDQRDVLASYVHRYTGDHRPNWVNDQTPLQFKNDKEWLQNTRFAVKNNGRLDKRVRQSYSKPTFPNNPEHRR